MPARRAKSCANTNARPAAPGASNRPEIRHRRLSPRARIARPRRGRCRFGQTSGTESASRPRASPRLPVRAPVQDPRLRPPLRAAMPRACLRMCPILAAAPTLVHKNPAIAGFQSGRPDLNRDLTDPNGARYQAAPRPEDISQYPTAAWPAADRPPGGARPPEVTRPEGADLLDPDFSGWVAAAETWPGPRCRRGRVHPAAGGRTMPDAPVRPTVAQPLGDAAGDPTVTVPVAPWRRRR